MEDKMPVPKPLDNEGPKTEIFNATVTKSDGDKFRKKLNDHDYTAAQLIRFWIKTYINQKDK